MSIAIVKAQIERFLKSDAPEVLAIKGAWGVGKTYSWNKFLGEAKTQNRISLDRYSYVSLFGVDSLEELKFLVFQQAIPVKLIGTEPSIHTFKDNAASLAESFGRKFLPFVQDTLLKNFAPAIRSLSFLSLKNTLICIDDFERKGKNLSAKDILGLISLFKERKSCKVVLILNDEAFEGESVSEYKRYREKVIDFEIEFKPDPAECADIALDNNDAIQRRLKTFIVDLGVSNIRIIKKIQRIAELIVPILKDFEDEVTHQALHSLALFSWCFYSTDDEVPNYEYVKNIGFKLYGLGDKDDVPEKEKKWNAILQNYKYLNTDEFDLQLANAVKIGYVIENDFLHEAEKLNSQLRESKSQGAFRDVWRLYHDTFENNQKEVMDGLYASLKTNVKHISPGNLNGTVRLFRELGEDERANELIKYFIENRKDEKGIFNLSDDTFGDITDDVIKAEFYKIYETRREKKSLKDVLSAIAGKNGWGGDDEEILASASVDDYYRLFIGEKGEHLPQYVNTCLQFGRFGNASEKQKKIGKSATQALRKIANESAINRLRAKKFGITLDDKDGESNA